MPNFKTKVINILTENKVKKSIIEEIQLLIETKSKRQTTYLLDNDNKPFAIFCYYHKQWELLSETSYGNKASTKTGLNTMCKVGVNQWTKQQKMAKAKETLLLNDLLSAKVDADEAVVIRETIEAERLKVIDGFKGYELDELKEMLK